MAAVPVAVVQSTHCDKVLNVFAERDNVFSGNLSVEECSRCTLFVQDLHGGCGSLRIERVTFCVIGGFQGYEVLTLDRGLWNTAHTETSPEAA